MKKLGYLLLLSLFFNLVLMADVAVVKSKGQSGNAERAVETVIQFTEQGTGYDVIPFWLNHAGTFNAGDILRIKVGAGESISSGQYGIIDYTGGGGGSSEYLDVFKIGYYAKYGTQLQVDDTFWEESGNKSGPTSTGYTFRQTNNEMTVIVPGVIATGVTQGSKAQLQAKSFHIVTLVVLGGSGSNSYIDVEYIGVATSADFAEPTIEPKSSIEVNP